MTDFFDWLTATDTGALAERLGSQFRLSQEEMRRTTDALVPAFMLGLQRSMLDGEAWTRLLRGYVSVLPAAGGSAALPSREAGEAFVRSLFGPELAGAVARQAALLTGQSPDVIEKMMPALGLLSFQSTLQTMAAFAGQTPGAYPSDPAGQAMAEAMRRSANAIEAFSRPAGTAKPAPQAMTDLFAGALRGLPWMNGLPGPGGAADPFGLMKAWTAGWTDATPEPPATRAAETGREADRPAGPFVFAGFLADAHSRQAQYMREMLAVFERHGARPGGAKD